MQLRCTYADSTDEPSLLVLKRTQKQAASLGSDADEGKKLKAERTDFSYTNEVTFLQLYSQPLIQREILVPQVIATHSSEDISYILMECMSQELGWEQHPVISSGVSTNAILSWLARFHAGFSNPEFGGGGLPIRPEGMWSHGRHMALDRRPAEELDRLESTLTSFLDLFEVQDAFYRSQEAHTIPSRVASIAAQVGARLHPGEGEAWTKNNEWATMVHGDFKQVHIPALVTHLDTLGLSCDYRRMCSLEGTRSV